MGATENIGVKNLLEAMTSVSQLRRGKQSGYTEKRRKKELDVGMDYLINANSRVGFGCHRKVFSICFDNAAAGGNFILTATQYPHCY